MSLVGLYRTGVPTQPFSTQYRPFDVGGNRRKNRRVRQPEVPVRRDPITEAVIRESFTSIVREMRRAFAASAYSSIIYEGYDFSCVLIDATGQLVAQSGEDHPFHVIPVAWSVRGLLDKEVSVDDQLIYLHNDPYTGGTHLNDVAIVYPVFAAGQPVFFIVLRAHWADIGGMTPGSLSGAAQEILQEGLRFDHVPVPKSGHSPVMDLIFDNVRVTHEAKADFHAAIGTCRVAELRLRAVLEKYGVGTVVAAANGVLESAEKRMRSALLAVPDGHYCFTSYLDGRDLGQFPLTVEIALTIEGELAIADFSGTATQVPAPLNAGPAIGPTSVLTILKSFLDPAGPINSGTLRPITVHVPKGTILHAEYPAPCGGLNEVRFAADAATMGALGQAVPQRMTGDVRGSTNHTYIGGTVSGQDFIFYEYPSGGTGGFSGADGNTAVRAFNEGENVSIQSSEIVERKYPLRVRRNEIRPDSGGPGQYRGGVGLIREIEVLSEGARFSLLSDRNLVPPYGVNGGRSGATNRFTVERKGQPLPTSEFPGKVSGFPLMLGDRVRMESSGGGGFGNPAARSEQQLKTDVDNGYVTPKGLADYGASIGKDSRVFRRDVSDETVDFEIGFSEMGIAKCIIGRDLREALSATTGQMLELVPQTGPPLRFWIQETSGEASTLTLDFRWQRRLPTDSLRLRITRTGTPQFALGEAGERELG